jgi:hypothetical protein
LGIIFQVPGEDDFTPVLFLTGGPDHGAWEVTLDGRPAGRIDTFRPQPVPWAPTEFSKHRLAAGEHRLVLTRAPDPPDRSGKQNADRAIGVVALQLRPHSRFIDQWSIMGNLPCPKDGGWKLEHEPERKQDLGAKYRLADGRTLHWREYRQPYVGLASGDWQVAYGLTYIHSPDDRLVAFFLAKDDGLKIWVNDRVVYDQNTWSHGWTDQFFCKAPLKKGWNKVLVKCANWSGAWGFAIRPGDPRNQLRFARQPD